jgi:hypothetical protein
MTGLGDTFDEGEEVTIEFMAAGAALEDRAAKKIPTLSEFLHNMPSTIRKEGAELVKMIQVAYPHMKHKLYESGEYVAVALNPKTVMANAAEGWAHVSKSFSEMYTQVRNDPSAIGKALFGKLSSFVENVSKSFNLFVENVKTAMTPAYEATCVKTHDLYVAASTKLGAMNASAREAAGKAYVNDHKTLSPAVESVSATAHNMYEQAKKVGTPVAQAIKKAVGMEKTALNSRSRVQSTGSVDF